MELKRWLRAEWDRAAAVASIAIGALALFLGYRGVRDALYPGEQIPYVISGGLFGLFAVGLGAVLWLSADLRDEWRKLDALDDKLDAILGSGLLRSPGVDSDVEPTTADTPAVAEAPAPAAKATRPSRASTSASTNGRRRQVGVS